MNEDIILGHITDFWVNILDFSTDSHIFLGPPYKIVDQLLNRKIMFGHVCILYLRNKMTQKKIMLKKLLLFQ